MANYANLASSLKTVGLTLNDGLKCDNRLKSTTFTLPGLKLLKLFPLDSVSLFQCQRNDEARLQTSLASHIFDMTARPDTQAIFQAVWFNEQLLLIDGNHRLRAWHSHSRLIMDSTLLIVYEAPTLEEIVRLYESINSRKGVKTSQDNLWSVFNYAGLVPFLQSTEMKRGKNLATVMKEFIPGQGYIDRGEVAKTKHAALLLLDEFFLLLPKKRSVLKLNDVFACGELLATLNLLHAYHAAGNQVLATRFWAFMEKELLGYIQYAMNGSRGDCPRLAYLFEEYEQLARKKGFSRSGESNIKSRAKLLNPMLQQYFEMHYRSVRTTAAKRTTK